MDLETLKFINPKDIRTRFAPAPTGLLHLGNARAALFNYLFAKKNQGVFILRIEDTDKERSKPGYERDILKNLKWLGINWDEGPEVGGNCGPYRQGERLDIYEKYIKQLLENEQAYFCFCSEEELESQKQYQLSRGEAPKYSGKCQDLTKKEINKNLREGKSSIIRFKISPKKVKFKDLVRGEVEFDMKLAGDIVIAKNLRYPLFVLAGAIDDFVMQISHIIRGEDHLSNTPKQILLQEALGFPIPEYAHLPLILGSDRTKLSKRHDAAPICEYKDQGYLPEALVNFIAFLGWNPGTEREIYSINSLVKEFSLERVQKGAAVSNVKRLDFLNGFYIRQKSIEKLTEMSLPYLIKAGLIEESADLSLKESDPEKLKLFLQTQPQFKNKETGETIRLDKLEKIVAIYRERLKKLSEIPELTVFFFRKKNRI
jgi:nondiscriminating glutamyl-tRNA synthetase